MSRLRLITEELRSFGSVVSIQGVRYLSDDQQGSLYRVIWLAIVATSFVVSGICIKNSIEGYELLKNGHLANFLKLLLRNFAEQKNRRN